MASAGTRALEGNDLISDVSLTVRAPSMTNTVQLEILTRVADVADDTIVLLRLATGTDHVLQLRFSFHKAVFANMGLESTDSHTEQRKEADSFLSCEATSERRVGIPAVKQILCLHKNVHSQSLLGTGQHDFSRCD